jgi:hypothetical protein
MSGCGVRRRSGGGCWDGERKGEGVGEIVVGSEDKVEWIHHNMFMN